jgi:hypothetical protein
MLKLNTLKKVSDKLMLQAQNDEDKINISCVVGVIFSIIYCIILAFYVHSILFTLVMAFWIAESIFESNLIIDYISKDKETKILNSVTYRILTKIIDLGIYVYVIYFIIINW